MPATIVVARGLLSPMPVYGRRFSAVGERVKAAFDSHIFRRKLENYTHNQEDVFSVFIQAYLCVLHRQKFSFELALHMVNENY